VDNGLITVGEKVKSDVDQTLTEHDRRIHRRQSYLNRICRRREQRLHLLGAQNVAIKQ